MLKHVQTSFFFSWSAIGELETATVQASKQCVSLSSFCFVVQNCLFNVVLSNTDRCGSVSVYFARLSPVHLSQMDKTTSSPSIPGLSVGQVREHSDKISSAARGPRELLVVWTHCFCWILLDSRDGENRGKRKWHRGNVDPSESVLHLCPSEESLGDKCRSVAREPCSWGSGSTGLTKFVWPYQKSRQNLSLPNFNLSSVGALRHSKIFVNHLCQSHETRTSIATFEEFTDLLDIAGAIDRTHKSKGCKRMRCRLL